VEFPSPLQPLSRPKVGTSLGPVGGNTIQDSTETAAGGHGSKRCTSRIGTWSHRGRDYGSDAEEKKVPSRNPRGGHGVKKQEREKAGVDSGTKKKTSKREITWVGRGHPNMTPASTQRPSEKHVTKRWSRGGANAAPPRGAPGGTPDSRQELQCPPRWAIC